MDDIEEVKEYIKEIEIFTEKLEKLRDHLIRYEEMLVHIRKMKAKSREKTDDIEEALAHDGEVSDDKTM